MRIFSTFILVMLITTAAISQDKFGEGYYVTNTSDSVRGFIEYKAHYTSGFKFRKELNGPTQYVTIDEVKSFGSPSGIIYARVEYSSKSNLPATPIFIRPVVQGEIDLFYLLQGKNIYRIG